MKILGKFFSNKWQKEIICNRLKNFQKSQTQTGRHDDLTGWTTNTIKHSSRGIHSSSNFLSNVNAKSQVDGQELPSQARVVIYGGGLLGSSVAYHLVDNGCTDVVLLDQTRVGEDTSWSLHSTGTIGQYKQSSTESALCRYSIELFQQLQLKGYKTGWKECGSLHLARQQDRILAFKRKKATLEASNIECSLLSPSEIELRCAHIRTDDLSGGLWIPGDGVGDPSLICAALRSEAENNGATVVSQCQIDKVETDNQCVTGVVTNQGRIKCEYFVNCAGIWAQEIGRMSHPAVKVPLYPVEQYYLHAIADEDVDDTMPVIRDYDGHIYIRINGGRYLAGGFDPVAKPVPYDDLRKSQPLDVDWDHFHFILQQILHRCPSMENATLEKLCNFPDCFTPDGKWILGESPEVRNYFVAAGMKTLGLASIGGVGKVLADWITFGDAQTDVWELDIRRFLGLHNNRNFLKDRVMEIPGHYTKISYPNREYKTGRRLRMSPIYPRLKAAGAVFGQIMGYERPNYFALHSDSGEEKIATDDTFNKPDWFENVKLEYKACRQKVALVDYSSFTKLELWSRDLEVVDLLQYLCSNDVDIAIGSVIHTGMQNHQGGYENDCSLIRLAENRYMMIAPTIQQTRSKVWISRHLPSNNKIALSDVTSMYTAICLMGPNSSNLLAELTYEKLDLENFPFFTYKEMSVALASDVRVVNLTHTGELGWVLYIPNEYALHVYDQLVEAGQKYGLHLAGNYANRTLRIERFYAYWGQDLDTMATPCESGRDFRVKFDMGIDFIGKEALLRQRENGVTKRYVQFVIDDHNINDDPWPCGGEPIYLNNTCMGAITTTGYGFTLKKHVCLGFIQCFDKNGRAERVTSDYILRNTFNINIAGKNYPAKANLHSKSLAKMMEDDADTYRATR